MHPQSRKSGLLPPTLLDIGKLAEQSRKVSTAKISNPRKKAAHPSLKRRLAAEIIETIVTRRKSGEKVKVLCEEYGISESGLNDLMTKAEAPVRANPITLEDIDMAVQLYESGLTVNQVVKQLGYSIRTIRRVLHQRGVVMRAGSTRK